MLGGWLDKTLPSPPNLSDLREIGNLWVVKATILLPVIGYLILFNAEIIRYLKLSSEITGTTNDATISWRLLAVYFGLLAIAVASVLYSWRCPILVKRYGRAADYVTAEAESIGEIALADLEEALRVNHPKEYAQLRDVVDRRSTRISASTDEAIIRANTIDIMQRVYLMANVSRPTLRRAIFVLFARGFLILLIPSLDVFVRCLLLLPSIC